MSKESKEAKKAAKAEKKASKQPKNPETSKSLISAVTAVICVAAIAITGFSVTDKICEANLKNAKENPAAFSNNSDSPVPQGGDIGTDVPSAEDPAISEDPAASEDPAISEDPAAGETPADPTAGGTSSSASSGTSSSTPSGSGTTAPAAKKDPSTKAEIVKVYNDAVNKVISSKAGYTKSRTTKLGQLEGAEAIMKIAIARDAVYDFLGVGTTTYTNKKGKTDYLSKAALSEADLKDAKLTNAGGIYTIVLSVKDGKSTAPTVSDTSPLQRCGLFAGNGDKKDYDYKNANNIYLGLNNSGDASVQSVSETVSNAKITAKVDSATGKLISLDASWHWDADLKKVKYTIITISGIGHADTSVSLKGIQW